MAAVRDFWPGKKRRAKERSDAYQVVAILRRKLPRELVPDILRYAEVFETFVLNTEVRRNIWQRVSPNPIIQSPPIATHCRALQAVQSVSFTVSSHDQGWVDSRDSGNWTWFSARIVKAGCELPRAADQQPIFKDADEFLRDSQSEQQSVSIQDDAPNGGEDHGEQNGPEQHAAQGELVDHNEAGRASDHNIHAAGAESDHNHLTRLQRSLLMFDAHIPYSRYHHEVVPREQFMSKVKPLHNPDFGTLDRELFKNEMATDEFSTKTVEWRADSVNPEEASWVQSLRYGDQIYICAWARFGGWRNIVRDAMVEVRTLTCTR